MRWSWISLLIIGSLEAASVTPVDGELIKGPVQLAADGVRVGDIIVPWNNVRRVVFTEPERSAKRAVVSRANCRPDGTVKTSGIYAAKAPRYSRMANGHFRVFPITREQSLMRIRIVFGSPTSP